MVKIPPHVLDWFEEIEKTAYQKGWDDATAALIEAAKARRPVMELPAATDSPTQRRVTLPTIRAGRETNRAAVVRALTAKPGMRPVDVPRWLQDTGTPMNSTSIMTLIKRMRRERNIEKRGDGLYLVGAGGLPTTPLLSRETQKEAAE